MEYTINLKDGVKSKEYNTPHAKYQILNRSVHCADEEYRSVVIDPDTKKILCFAPPKSVSIEQFTAQNIDTEEIEATEIIEGTMINLFYDERIQSWEIATKSAIGGNYWFFRTQYNTNKDEIQLTFRDMFIEAFRESPGTKLNDIAFIQTLDKTMVYSFVLQHPYNHIVLPIGFASVYIVAVYKIVSENMVRYIPFKDISLDFINSHVLRPSVCKPSDCDTMKLCDYRNMGIMLYNPKTGLRTSVLNPQYTTMKEFRGNNPNLQYQYLCLSRIGKVKEYLDAFPIYKNMFYGFNQQSAAFIRMLHNAYVTYFINKRGRDVQIDRHIFRHICNLHNRVYLPSLNSGNKIIVNRKVVADYFNAMEPKEQLYHVNYQNREFLLDKKCKIESEYVQ